MCHIQTSHVYGVILIFYFEYILFWIESESNNGNLIRVWIQNQKRPDMTLLPPEVSKNYTDLMQACWSHAKMKRPTFIGDYNSSFLAI